MSINKYNAITGSLEAISQGRVWIGTKAEWEATVQSGSYPKNVLVAITDDEQGPVDVVEEDNPNAVSSGGVYDVVKNLIITRGATKSQTFTANVRTNVSFTTPTVAGYRSLGLIKVGTTASNTFTCHWIYDSTAQCTNGSAQTMDVYGVFLFIKDI